MQSVEITAKSIEDAKKAASEKLNVAIGSLKVTILEETKGLFGKSSVRVLAEVIPAPVEAAPAKAEAPAPKVARGKTRIGASTTAAKTPAPAAAPAPVVEPEPEVVATAAVSVEAPKEKRNARPPRGRNAKTEAPASSDAPATEETAEETSTEIVATAEDSENLAALLRELLDSAGVTVTVTPAGIAGRYVNLQLDGKDAAFLVGKHGEVLNALQYLVNIIAGRRFNNGVRATLDGNDYRKRREDTLTQLATNIAEQVKKRGEEAVLDALPAFERRVVHKALSVIEGIQTYSEGEEPNRRVVIAPAD